jgi:hypothetical protein
MTSRALLFDKNWEDWTKRAAVLVAVMVIFLHSPPELWEGSGPGTTYAFAQFAVIFLLGLLTVVGSDAFGRQRWVITAVILFLAGASSYLVYSSLTPVWSCAYQDEFKVIGTTYTSRGAAMAQANPSFSCKEMLEAALGRSNQIWDDSQILNRYFWMRGLYLLAWFAMATSVLALTNAAKAKPQASIGAS